jgi:hypothetical protein
VRLTALLPLRRISLTALARGIERPTQLAPDGCSLTGTRVARCPYRRLLREAASSAPRGRRFGPLRGRARLPLTPLSHPAASSRWPPGTEDRRRPPPVKEAGCSIRGAFHRTSARAFAGFCNRERFSSTAVNRLDPARARPRFPSRLTVRAAPPLTRPCRPRFLGSGESDAASATPHPPPGVPGGLTPKPICASTPVARSWHGRLDRPTLPRHQVPLQGAEAPSYRDEPALPLAQRRAGGPPLARRACREAGSTGSSAKRSPVSPSPGCFRTKGTPCLPPVLLHRLLPTCGWITSLAVRVARRLRDVKAKKTGTGGLPGGVAP